YSTAVGPSSRRTKLVTRSRIFVNMDALLKRGLSEAEQAVQRLADAASRINLTRSRASLAGSRIQTHVVERVVRRRAEGGDRRDAHDDDQGQHDRILDRRRAVLSLQKPLDSIVPLRHGILPCRMPRPRC